MWWEENAVGVGIDEHQRFNTCAPDPAEWRHTSGLRRGQELAAISCLSPDGYALDLPTPPEYAVARVGNCAEERRE